MKTISILKRARLALGLVAVLLMAPVASFAATYTFVGSWVLGEGERWTDNPEVLTGQETAALLFGGSAGNYAISTIDALSSNINFSTWMDGWGDATTYALSGTPAAHDFKFSTGGTGYNDTPGIGNSYSAYVNDHFDGSDVAYTNYAFAITAVPVPAGFPLILTGVAAFGWMRRKTKSA